MNINISIPWLTRKRLLGILLPLLVIPIVIATSASACSSSSGATANANANNDSILGHYYAIQPPLMPTGPSVYRDTMTFAQATHILGLNTYSFFMRRGGNGSPFFECASEGSAVPNTAQLTNPQVYVSNAKDSSLPSDGVAVVGNIDPDGLFPPSASQGTYVRCLYSNGKPYLVYSEPDVLQVNASAAHWDPSLYGGQGGIVVPGDAIDGKPVCVVRQINQSQAAASPQPSGSTSSGPILVTNCKAAPGSTPHN